MPTILLSGAMLVGLVACKNESADAQRLAVQATEAFHQQFNAAHDRDLLIIHAASEHPEFAAYLHSPYVRDIRTNLGFFRTATVKNCKTTSRPAGIDVVLTLNSQFERGVAAETISFLVTGTSAVMNGYSVIAPEIRNE